jgi:DNA invertase Pin-like site-specific DNA recombinase
LHGDGAKVVFYKDKFTGKTMDRPGWQRLQRAIESGNVTKVVVWRLDRLGRTASGLTKLFDDLRSRKIGLVSIKDGLDLETPAGRLMANVLASIAQFETEVRAERVLAGQAAARAEGKTWGGSVAGRLLHVTREQIDVIRRMHAAGDSKTAMAKATGLSRPTIYRILSQHVA